MSNWISCKDRLPSTYQDVLVTDGERYWVASIHEEKLQFWLASHPDYRRSPRNEFGCPFATFSVPTHWMPLPEPPNE